MLDPVLPLPLPPPFGQGMIAGAAGIPPLPLLQVELPEQLEPEPVEPLLPLEPEPVEPLLPLEPEPVEPLLPLEPEPLLPQPC